MGSCHVTAAAALLPSLPIFGSFPKIEGAPYFGVRRRRILLILFRVLHQGPLCSETPIFAPNTPRISKPRGSTGPGRKMVVIRGVVVVRVTTSVFIRLIEKRQEEQSNIQMVIAIVRSISLQSLYISIASCLPRPARTGHDA